MDNGASDRTRKKEGNAGSLHSHCILFDDEYIPFDAINKAWGKGNTDIHKLNDINNVGAYVSKYLTKETYSEFSRHSYHISRVLQNRLNTATTAM